MSGGNRLPARHHHPRVFRQAATATLGGGYGCSSVIIAFSFRRCWDHIIRYVTKI